MSDLRYGRLPKREDPQGRTLMMAKYVTNVPDPPQAVDNLARVYAKLGINDPTVLFPMDGNNQYGDCTIAALAHYITLANGLVGIKKIPAEQDVIDLYFKYTNGQDTGCNELDVMKSWHKKGCFGEKTPYYVAIDPLNHREVMQTIWLFGAVYIGFNVQQNAISDFEKRIPWTAGTPTNEGHAILTPNYDADFTTKSLTWGNDQLGYSDWWDKRVDECWLAVPPEAQQPDFLPGFDWDQLMADAQVIAGTNKKKCWFFGKLFN
jgi:hypothetical protein